MLLQTEGGGVRVSRQEMLEVTEELKMILVEKEVTPTEAEIIAGFLVEKVQTDNEKEKRRYMTEGRYK